MEGEKKHNQELYKIGLTDWAKKELTKARNKKEEKYVSLKNI